MEHCNNRNYTDSLTVLQRRSGLATSHIYIDFHIIHLVTEDGVVTSKLSDTCNCISLFTY